MTSKSIVEDVLETEFEEESADDSLDAPLEEDVIRQAVLFATDWTVGTILDQLKRKNIDVGPRFQRRDVWKLNRKSKYIESLMLHLPVPHIVLAEMRDKRGKYLVLDGRQRLLSLMQFAGLAEDSNKNNFSLVDLDVLKNAKGRDWAGLDELGELKTQLENAPVRCVVVRNWTNDRLLHLLFTRLNMETVKLNAQELRLALYPGGFVYFVDDQSIKSDGLARLFDRPSGTVDPRMRDAELLVRYFAFRQHLAKYDGAMRTFLNDACRELNKTWDQVKPELTTQMEEFERAVLVGNSLFGDGFGKRWNTKDKKFVGHPNRAVLDLLLFYLAQIPDVEIGSKGTEIPTILRNLFETTEFVASIDATARHARNSADRFYLLGDALREAGFSVTVPERPTDS